MLALIHMGPLSYGNEDIWVREAGENFFGDIIAPGDGDIVRLDHSDIQVVKHKNNLWGPLP